MREWRKPFSLGLCLAIVVAILASAAAQEKASIPAATLEKPKSAIPPQDGAKAPDKPMQAEAHYEIGVMYHERVFESLDQAIAEYEKAVKLKPEYAEAHFNLALSYHTKAKLGTDDMNLYRKALSEYKLYLKYSPNGDLAAKAKQNIKAVEARLRP